MAEGDKARGWYGKYIVSKADGTPVDPQAVYLVLRLDTDNAARNAAYTYAALCPNDQLASDIFNLADRLDQEHPLRRRPG